MDYQQYQTQEIYFHATEQKILLLGFLVSKTKSKTSGKKSVLEHATILRWTAANVAITVQFVPERTLSVILQRVASMQIPSRNSENTLRIALIAVLKKTAFVRAVRVLNTTLHASIHSGLALEPNSLPFPSPLSFLKGDCSSVT